MKNLKKNSLFLGMVIASLALAGCGKETGSQSNTKDKRPTVTIYENGDADPTVKKVELGDSIEKPADPTAPAGKKFYGWMNTKNGGQIWNFEDETLKAVMGDVELKPCFVPADQDAQLLEAELCRDITEKIGKDGTPGMDGVTYSGGQKGRGLIGRDYDEFGASGAYVRDDAGIARFATEADKADENATVFAAFVHYNYENGNTLTFNINSDKAVENVTMFMSISGEYGLPESTQIFEGTGEDRVFELFTDEDFKVTVNDEDVKYGTITIHNIVPKTFLQFQDFMLSTTVSLKAGANTIVLKVDNTETLNGTIASTAPVVDCLKLYSESTITWEEAKISNMDKEE